jgi:hypothetical protein
MKVPVIVLPCEACPRSLATVLRSLRQQQKSVGFCTLLQTALTFDLQHKRDCFTICRIKKCRKTEDCLRLALVLHNLFEIAIFPTIQPATFGLASVFQRAVRERDKCGLGENHPPAPSIWAELTLYISHQPSFSCQGHNSSPDRLA